MKIHFSVIKLLAGLGLGFVVLTASAQALKVNLSGTQEVPAVTTKATGMGDFTVNDDGAISGSVTTSNINGTMAHIHEAAKGKNGLVIIKLEKTGDHVWSVPAGTKLTKEQMESFKKGNLYANVHSEAKKSGEIRGQLQP